MPTIKSPSSGVRTVLHTLLLLLWCIVMPIIHIIARCVGIANLAGLHKQFHKGCCWLFSLNLTVKGELSEHKPTLFLVNHISYLDIFVLGSLIPGYFIAKSEVASWPILGRLARFQNTLFFERNSKKVRGQIDMMQQHFDNNGNLMLFPEGTSTEGEHVEPFKSSLLQAVERASVDVMIQPVTLAYTHYKGKPMDRNIRDHYAWYASMPFASHFFNALGLAKANVSVVYHEPVKITDYESRKECAHACWEMVNNGLLAELDNDTQTIEQAA